MSDENEQTNELDDNDLENVAGGYALQPAFPVKWSTPKADSGGTDIAMEKITIVHEGIERD